MRPFCPKSRAVPRNESSALDIGGRERCTYGHRARAVLSEGGVEKETATEQHRTDQRPLPRARLVHPQDLQPHHRAPDPVGISVWGSRELRVRGRTSGEWRTVPVNLLDTRRAALPRGPRGTHAMGAQPARGAARRAARRPAGGAVPRDRRSTTTTRSQSCAAYLRRWKMEVGVFFDGVGPDATDEELRAIADRHPVFLVDDAVTKPDRSA